MALEDDLRVLLNTYPAGEYMIETIEISHPLFSKVYYLTREPAGIIATLEDMQVVNFVGTNIDIKLNSTKSDLDQNFSFTMPDLNNELDDELDRIPLDDSDKIVIKYRVYINTDLSGPAQGPVLLEALSVSQEKGIFTISAGAPQLNWNKTGIIYDYDTFPMLRAL